MAYRLFILLVLIGSFQYSTVRAQDKKVYLDYSKEVVPSGGAIYLRVYHPDTKYPFKVDEYNMKTKTLNYTGYTTSDDKPYNTMKMVGHFVYYNEDGTISEEGDYKDSKKNGKWTKYYQSGEIWATYYLKDDKFDGELVSYYKDGNVKRRAIYDHDTLVKGHCVDEQGNMIPFTEFFAMTSTSHAYDLGEYLSKNIIYPDNAKEHNVQGRVIVRFVVEGDGSITNATVVKSVSPELDAEALRVILKMPKWNAAVVDDNPVKVYFTLPITFKLD